MSLVSLRGHPAGHPRTRLLVAVAMAGLSAPASAIDIQFDYRWDTGFFTDNPNRRALLESAASEYERRIGDSLSAITSGAGGSFTGAPRRPDNGELANLPGLSIAADTIVVYAGARNLDSLGRGGASGWGAGGTAAFLDNARRRGQEGVVRTTEQDGPATDYSLWGGSITFDTDANWYFDDDLTTSGDIGFRQNDFYSVALHELGHVFGLGSADSWDAMIVDGKFVGPEVSELVPGGVEVVPGNSHFNFGIESINTDGNVQEVLMDPDLTTGTRKILTALDLAAMSDLGWDIVPAAVPLPASGLLLLGALGALGLQRRVTAKAGAT